MPEPIDAAELVALGRSEGLDAVGIALAEPLVRARRVLEERKAAGLHHDMAFTYGQPTRSTDPERVVADARAVVVGVLRYPVDVPARPGSTGSQRPLGRVARYAWADHYADLERALGAMARLLRDAGWRAVVVADDNAMVDREVAWQAGLGWFGKNANLLLPGRGSWFVLGSVVTDAPLPASRGPVADGCGSCRRCIDGCPTGAIVAPGVVDARRCLAWLAQRAGVFPREHRVALGDRIYGCDDCQEVCPPNRHQQASAADPDAVAWLDLLDLLAAPDHELLARHGRWYLADRDPRWIRRNALIALGNVAAASDPEVVACLARYLRGHDAVLRAHAVWAAGRLGRKDLLELVHDDVDPTVLAELAASTGP